MPPEESCLEIKRYVALVHPVEYKSQRCSSILHDLSCHLLPVGRYFLYSGGSVSSVSNVTEEPVSSQLIRLLVRGELIVVSIVVDEAGLVEGEPALSYTCRGCRRGWGGYPVSSGRTSSPTNSRARLKPRISACIAPSSKMLLASLVDCLLPVSLPPLSKS